MANDTWGGMSASINVNELTELVRHAAQPQQAMSQLANPPTGRALGLGRGDTVQYTFFPNMTTSGGELDENDTIPAGSITPVKATYTVKEYGNSLTWTGKLEDLSRLTLEDSFMKALMDDMQKLMNTQVYNQAKLTDYKAVFNSTGDEFVTNGTPTKTADQDLSLANLSFVRRKAKANNIPLYDGESYVYVADIDSSHSLQDDSALTDILREDSGRAALNGEIGRVKGCRVVEDNHKLAKATGSLGEGFLFGADAVGHEVALPWEIRREVKDFGRSIAVAYYGIMAWFKIMDQTTHSQEHIIHVTSA
ncbi:MAG: hypothetical protein D6694_12775 [Gammaproteobacteria bacterium]|nr:MAG: hypothetical protein D6694_12775 [Gammaproteobacteria bacterium]